MKYVIFFTLLLLAAPAQAWVVNANFENGNIGSKAKGSDGFNSSFSNTKYTNAVVHSGRQAAVTSIKQGEYGFGKWGGLIRLPATLGEGKQVWFRAWIYYPAGFSFTNNGIGVKTLRLHTKSSTGSNDGYFDVLTNKNGLTVGIEQTSKIFIKNNPNWRDVSSGISTGVWYAYEMYVKLSSVPGKGIYRVWLNGKLLLNDTKTPTLKSAGSKADFIYIWSYFNDSSPKDQKAYVDDIIITNEVPGGRDAQGNRFIGIGTQTWTARPKPPTPNE